jgi:hypothetical protein
VQDPQFLVGADQERDRLGAEHRLVADLLDVENVGDRHEPVAHRAQLFRSLEAERAAGLHGDLHLAAGRLADFLGEALGVLGVEVSVRPHRREIEIGRSRCGAGECGAGQNRAGPYREFTSCEHDRLPSLTVSRRSAAR